MAKQIYEEALVAVENTEDVVFNSNGGVDSYLDPWGVISKLEL